MEAFLSQKYSFDRRSILVIAYLPTLILHPPQKRILLFTDAPRMKQQDISFALTVVLHALVPPYKQMTGGSNKAGGCELGRVGSVASYHKTARSGPKEFILNVAFLGEFVLHHRRH